MEWEGDLDKALVEMKHLFQKSRSLFAITMVTIQDEPERQVRISLWDVSTFK